MLKIKDLRVEKGYTQKVLAEKINTSAKNIWAWENEKCEPCISDLNKLARLFDVTVDYLTGNTDEMGTLIQSAPSDNLSENERSLIRYFQQLGPFEQEAILIQVKALAEKSAVKTK